MLTKKQEDGLREMLQKQWCNKYFHNDRTLSMGEMNRDVERANSHYRANGSAAIFRRIKAHLRNTGQLELGVRNFEIRTRNKRDTREWAAHFGSIKIFHNLSRKYDLAIKEIVLATSGEFHRVKVVFQTKDTDEGYFGGKDTLAFEDERIREERKHMRE